MEKYLEKEKEKEEIISFAEDKFGKVYFEQLKKLVDDYNVKKNYQPKYTIITSHEGAFYAREK